MDISKKRLLFVIDSLKAAGAEKSLINLLSVFDFNKYQVDLMLLSNTGEFKSQLPPNVNVLKNKDKWTIFGYPLAKSVKYYLSRGEKSLVFHRIRFALKAHLVRKRQKGIQKLWKHMSKALPEISKEYDVAIAYMEKYPLYTVVEKTNAAIKIGWIHIDYRSYKLNKKIDFPYFSKLNHIVAVSEQCSKVLNEVFPMFSKKISIIENIICPGLLYRLAGEPCEIKSLKKTVILTIGRLAHQKGIDLAIDAAKMLVKNGYDFNWYVIGEGPDYKRLQRMIVKKKLKNNFFLLGIKSNPYPYIKRCDIYVQPSRFEGKSIAIEEVKSILRPIVVTRYPTVNNQLTDGFNCIMTDMNSEGIYKGIKQFLDEPVTREKVLNNLKKQNLENTSEVNKLYNLINRS